MKLEKIKRLAIFWITIVFMFSCTSTPQNRHQFDVGLPTSRPTVTLISSITPFVPTPLPTKTPTQTPIPTNTSIPSPTSRTPIPVQNLDLEEAKQKMDFLAGNSNCQLPCFNGLTPGISSAWDVQEFFARLGLSDELLRDENGPINPRDAQGFWDIDPIQGSIGGPVPYLLTSNFFSYKPFIGVEWSDGLVTNITLGPLPYRAWISIPRFCEKLGKPDVIKITDLVGEGNGVVFELVLYYSIHKIYIDYNIISSSLTDVCFNSDTLIDTFVAIGSPSLPLVGYAELRNWHEINGMDFDELVNKVGTGDFCIPYAVEK